MCSTNSKPRPLRVGILTADAVTVDFGHGYRGIEGQHRFTAADLRGERAFRALGPDSSFTVRDVVIGIDFHWERREDQRFAGDCLLVPVDGKVCLINEIDVEDYLESVISSEMSATASPALLRAHAVISRSWVLAQIHRQASEHNTVECDCAERLVRWYDHSAHTLFDVCADDHCQRYQGLHRRTTAEVSAAVRDTAGQVLRYEGKLCDARFSKCCGGVFEEFENCWEPEYHGYLVARADTPTPLDYPDLHGEAAATAWIEGQPDAFCNTADAAILSQVLNGYDQETADFYRWQVEYTNRQLSELILRRSGVDYGSILSLTPLKRGTSGRIIELEIRGTKRTRVIGKELEIRRTLSESHLYSSAFTVRALEPDADGMPARFVLRGAGWGHGVGLCQIGAAVMGARGYDYRQILDHYFPGATIPHS